MASQTRRTRTPAGNIVLIGFMGTGKSSLGKRLAQTLGWPLIDTDVLTEKKAGRTIAEIFASEGEQAFRDLETGILKSLGETFHTVISTGGGVILRKENRELLSGLGLVIWLHAAEEAIFERVSRNKKRPLLHTPNPRQTLHDLLEKRTSLYAEVADVRVDTGRMSPPQAIHAILLAAQDFSEDPENGTRPSPDKSPNTPSGSQ